MVRPSTLLFDFDGTLVDSGPGIVATWNHTNEVLGLAPETEAQIRARIGPPLIVQAMVISDGDDARARQIVEVYLERYRLDGIHRAQVYPGIVEMLTALAAGGFRMAVATSKTETVARTMLDDHALAAFFEVTVGSMLDGSRHSKIDVIAHALDQLEGCDRSATVMIGDRHHDIEGAIHHGLGSIGVLWGYGTAAELRQAGAERIVDSPADLASAVTDTNGLSSRTR